MPFNLSSDSVGILEISAINITYDYNISTLFDISYFSSFDDGYYYINNTNNNASNNISIDGYYVSSGATKCRINNTIYSTTGSPTYCPFSENILQGDQYNDYKIIDDVIDSKAPRIKLYSPKGNNYGKGHSTIDLNFTYNEGNVDTCWYNYNGSNTTISCFSNTSFIPLENQQSTLTLYSNDSIGNINSTSVTFLVDTTPPTLSSANPTSVSVLYTGKDQNHVFRINANDSLAGIDTVLLEFNGVNYTASLESGTTYMKNFTGLDVGSYTFRWYANDSINDSSGNVASSTQYTYSIVSTSGGGGGGGSASVSPVCGDNVCTYPENVLSCPQDCANMTFTLDISSYKLPGFPGGLVTCLGESGTCSITIKNNHEYPINVSVKIIKVLNFSADEWAHIIDNGKEVKEVNYIVPANGFRRVKFKILIPQDVEFGQYRFDAIFQNRDAKTDFPFIIDVQPAYGPQIGLSRILTTVSLFLSKGIVIPRFNFKITVWMALILLSIILIIIYMVKK